MRKTEILDEHARKFAYGPVARLVAGVRGDRIDPVLAIVLIRQQVRYIAKQADNQYRIVLILVAAKRRSDPSVVRGEVEETDVSTLSQPVGIIRLFRPAFPPRAGNVTPASDMIAEWIILTR